MEMTKAESVKDELMTSNSEFRELVREHHRYEERLSELSALRRPIRCPSSTEPAEWPTKCNCSGLGPKRKRN